MPKAIFAKHGMATKHDWIYLYVLIFNDLFSYVTDPIVRALPQKTSAQIVPEGRTKFPKTWTAQETCPTSRRPVKRLFDNHQRLCCQSPPAPNCLLDMNFCRCSKLQSSLPQGNWSSIPEKGEVTWFCKNGSIYLGLNGVHIKLPSLQITFSFQSCSQTFTCSNISLSTGDCEMWIGIESCADCGLILRHKIDKVADADKTRIDDLVKWRQGRQGLKTNSEP